MYKISIFACTIFKLIKENVCFFTNSTGSQTLLKRIYKSTINEKTGYSPRLILKSCFQSVFFSNVLQPGFFFKSGVSKIIIFVFLSL